jgi:hypothetical protein
MLGSRGALITALIYTLILIIIDKENRKNILMVAIILIISIGSGSFLSLFLKLSNHMAVTSRTLDLLMGGNIAQDEGRLGTFSIIWNSVLNSPFVGYGIYGDRIILDGIYCHNFFLEIFCDFGLFFGSVIILLLSFVIIRAFLSSDSENKKLLLMFFCYCFIPLMVSLSYLAFPQFGIFIGFLFLNQKSNRKINIINPIRIEFKEPKSRVVY